MRNMKKVSHLTGCRQVYDNRISRQPGRGTLVITQPTTEDIGEFSPTLCPLIIWCEWSTPKKARNNQSIMIQFLKWRKIANLHKHVLVRPFKSLVTVGLISQLLKWNVDSISQLRKMSNFTPTHSHLFSALKLETLTQNCSNEETIQFEHWRRVAQLLQSNILKIFSKAFCFWQTSD